MDRLIATDELLGRKISQRWVDNRKHSSIVFDTIRYGGLWRDTLKGVTLHSLKISDQRRRSACVVAAAAIALLATGLSPSFARERRSDKIAVSEEVVNGKAFYVNRVIVNARPELVWQVLADYRNATKTFPLLKKCEVLQVHGNKRVVKHQLTPSGVPITYEYVIEVTESAPNQIEWHRVSGDFKELDGFWKLEPTEFGNCTLVTYATHVTGGFFMPQPLIRHQFSIDMPIVLDALKNKAEANTQIAARRVDSFHMQ